MTTRPTLHIIAQAHLDPVWLWRWRDGAAQALTTIQGALDRMDEVPDLCFSHSSAASHRWVQQLDPRMFERIRQRVREGRWEPVGGWIVESDCNLPSAESFVRQALYGKRWFADHLGADVTIGYNVDSFGHSGGVPQLLARAGYRYYVMMRPGAHEADLPQLFCWESADGSRVLTLRVSPHYGQSAMNTPDDVEKHVRTVAERNVPPGIDHAAFFFGVGNHGGGPTKAHLARVLELQRDASLPDLRFSTLAQFFAEVERSPNFTQIPVVRGELQHHARGCYSAKGDIKALNRRTERALVKAETLSTITCSSDEDLDRFEEAWWQLLFNQCHDVLAGSSIPSAYQDARDEIGAARATADDIAVHAMHRLARSVDTSNATSSVLFAMNPLPWSRTTVVELDTFVTPSPDETITHLRTPDGSTIPIQWTAPEWHPDVERWRRLTVAVDLPACGYRVFDVVTQSTPSPRTEPPPWPDRFILSDDTLGLTSLRTPDGTEMLAEPLTLLAITDESDTWGHETDAFRDVLGHPTLESTRVVEDGPIVRTVRQRGRWRDSMIELDIITWRHTDAVELRLRADWRERRQILKLAIPTALRDVRTIASAPGGIAERIPDGGEEATLDWLALEGAIDGAKMTVGVVNDATYAYDCVDGELRLTCLRSTPYAEHRPWRMPDDFAGPWLDHGWQERRFWLVGGRGKYTSLDLPRMAEELQSPADVMLDSAHAGDRAREASFLEVSPANVAFLACKTAESRDGLILRLQETTGRETEALITRPEGNLGWTVNIGARQIRTFVISAQGNSLQEVDLLERAL